MWILRLLTLEMTGVLLKIWPLSPTQDLLNQKAWEEAQQSVFEFILIQAQVWKPLANPDIICWWGPFAKKLFLLRVNFDVLTTEKTDLKTGLRNKNDPTTCCLQETHINYNDKGRPNINRLERDTLFKH